MTDEISPELKDACFKVGYFLYHFALLEEQINLAIKKLFGLNDVSSKILCANIDFFKKLNVVQTCIIEQFSDKNGHQIDRKKDNDYTSVFNAMRWVNDERIKVVHSPFKPSDKGILFQRVIARDGVLKQSHEENEWDEQTFESIVQKIIDTTKRFEGYVEELQPYEPKLDFSDSRNSGYLALFC